MAYNNYFPVGYQPYIYPTGITPQYNQQATPQDNFPHPGQTLQPNTQSAQNEPIWVQGEAGAKAYPVAPNNSVRLWDSEAQIIYWKSADATGRPSMQILDYTIRDTEPRNTLPQKAPQVDLSGYVTREEFDKKIAELKAVKEDE